MASKPPTAEDAREALSDYTAGQRRVETLAVVTYGLLALWSIGRLCVSTNDAVDTCLVVATMLSGWLAADLFSGLVHWAFDTWEAFVRRLSERPSSAPSASITSIRKR